MGTDTMYFSSLIDFDLWDQAGWRGVFFVVPKDPLAAPLVALVFDNPEAGLGIMRGWRERMGESDEEDFLYLSFVEGNAPGRDPGYFALLGIDWKVALRHAHERGIEMPVIGTMLRFLHMETADPVNLCRFKDAVRTAGNYHVGVARLGPSGPQFAPETMRKQKVQFRRFEELTESDPEWAVTQPQGSHA